MLMLIFASVKMLILPLAAGIVSYFHTVVSYPGDLCFQGCHVAGYRGECFKTLVLPGNYRREPKGHRMEYYFYRVLGAMIIMFGTERM